MGLWASLRRRRIFPFLGAYIAAGFLALEGVDQLVGNGLLPLVAYQLVLVIYLFGLPATAILAWFHGEKGAQKPGAVEIWVQLVIVVAALAVCGKVVKDYLETARTGLAEAEAAGMDARRVAVLYFEDLSRDGELAYVADGLTETLIERLSQVRALDVISRNGVAPFRASEISRDSIARALEVGSLIAGSVEQSGDKLRVTVRLVDGVSGADFQRQSFEVPAADLLVVRDSVGAEVAVFLRERLGEEVRLRERRAQTSSAEAWGFVQRAERFRKDAEEFVQQDDMDAAYSAFDRADSILAVAEAVDREWVEPTVLRGQIAYRRARISESDDDYLRLTDIGLDHAARVLEMEQNNPDALELRGTLRYATWVFFRPPDPAEADRLLESAQADLEAATRADPTLASAHSTLSHLYYQVEDVPAAVLAARRAYEEDAYLALADQVLWRLYNGSIDIEQFAQAVRWCDEGERRFPDNYRFTLCKLILMTTPAEAADVDRAWELRARLQEVTPESLLEYEQADGLIQVAGVLARAGLPDSSRSVLGRAHAVINTEIDPTEFLLLQEAYVFVLLRDYEAAVDLLERYSLANPGHFDSGSATSWWWRDLQGHPGYQALVGTGTGASPS